MEEGKIHLTGSASKTRGRERFVYFSEPYIQSENNIYLRADQLEKYKLKNVNDIIRYNNYKLGVIRGYQYGGIYEELSKTRIFSEHLFKTDKVVQNFKLLKDGRIDGLIANQFIASFILKQHDWEKEIVYSGVTVAKENSYFMLSRKSTNKSFVDEFNKTLKDFKEDPDYRKILEKYLK